jgi:transcriptional regulator with XRE-family HTH domain
MSAVTAAPTILEIWMELKDHTLLAELMETKKISARNLATEAGWKSHTYLQRLLRGEVKTLKAEPAARIAYKLEVPFNLLFVTRASTNSGQSVPIDRKVS